MVAEERHLPTNAAAAKRMKAAKKGARGNAFPRCAFFGYFLCTSKESNKENTIPARVVRGWVTEKKPSKDNHQKGALLIRHSQARATFPAGEG